MKKLLVLITTILTFGIMGIGIADESVTHIFKESKEATFQRTVELLGRYYFEYRIADLESGVIETEYKKTMSGYEKTMVALDMSGYAHQGRTIKYIISIVAAEEGTRVKVICRMNQYKVCKKLRGKYYRASFSNPIYSKRQIAKLDKETWPREEKKSADWVIKFLNKYWEDLEKHRPDRKPERGEQEIIFEEEQ